MPGQSLNHGYRKSIKQQYYSATSPAEIVHFVSVVFLVSSRKMSMTIGPGLSPWKVEVSVPRKFGGSQPIKYQANIYARESFADERAAFQRDFIIKIQSVLYWLGFENNNWKPCGMHYARKMSCTIASSNRQAPG